MEENRKSYIPDFTQALHLHKQNVEERRRVIKSFKAKADAKRTLVEKFADSLTTKFGSVTFLFLNATWFSIWIVVNTRITPLKAFDPFPFGLLTMIVSLEAIFLAIIVLISQNREARIGELREEVELQISTLAEVETTKLISLMIVLMEKQGIKIDDPELKAMLKPMDTAKLESDLEKELS